MTNNLPVQMKTKPTCPTCGSRKIERGEDGKKREVQTLNVVIAEEQMGPFLATIAFCDDCGSILPIQLKKQAPLIQVPGRS